MKLTYSGERMTKELKTKRIIELDIDVREAAKKIGISPATLSRLENGNTPDVNTLAMTADWLDCAIEDFFVSLPTKKKKLSPNKKH